MELPPNRLTDSEPNRQVDPFHRVQTQQAVYCTYSCAYFNRRRRMRNNEGVDTGERKEALLHASDIGGDSSQGSEARIRVSE